MHARAHYHFPSPSVHILSPQHIGEISRKDPLQALLLHYEGRSLPAGRDSLVVSASHQ